MTSFWFGLSARGWEGLVWSGCSNGISQAFVPHSSEAISPRPVSDEGALCPHLVEGSDSSGGPFHNGAGPTHGGPTSSHHHTGGQDHNVWIWGHSRCVATAMGGHSPMVKEGSLDPCQLKPSTSSLHPDGLCGSLIARIPEPGFTCAEMVAPLSRCFSECRVWWE